MKKSDLRILFVIDAIEQRNGVGTYFHDLVKQLRGRIAHAELVAPGLDDPHPCQGLSLPMPGDPTQRLFLPKLREMTQLVLDMKPHVIVVPGPGIFSLAALWLGMRTGTPVCVTHQTDYNQLANLYWRGIMARFMSGALRWLTRMIFHRASSVAAISEHMVAQVRDCGIAHPALVATPLAPAFVQNRLQPGCGKLESVFFAGRLAAEKNLESLVELALSFPQLRFTVAGDGPLRPMIERAAATLPNFSYLGWCQRDDVVRLVDEHDMLILPSKVEAFGTVALEAMARQRLVMTAAGCGINQWPGMEGALVMQQQDEEISATLVRLLAMSDAQRRQIAAQARERALQVNNVALDQWHSLLTLTAGRRATLPEPGISPAYFVLRRMAS